MTEYNIIADNRFVTFELAKETYAIPISQAREVVEYDAITRVPKMPAFVQGVMNLRGGVLPVIDLQEKLGLGRLKKTRDSRAIVIEMELEGEPTTIGALADAVRDVVELKESEIGPPPRIGTKISSDFIKAVGRKNDQFIIILNVNSIFSMEDLSVVADLDLLAEGKGRANGGPDNGDDADDAPSARSS